MGAFRLLWAGKASAGQLDTLVSAGDVSHGADLVEVARLINEFDFDAAVIDRDSLGEGLLPVMRQLRNRAQKRHLPVLVLTDGPVEVKLEAFGAGADDVVSASISSHELTARLLKGLSMRQRTDRLLEESARLHELSLTDGLTRIANHRHFQDRLRDEFLRAHRYDDPLALVMIDIDHFKAINDRFGHLVGDTVLQEVAECLRRSVRETDFVSRYGGEEFAVILPKTHVAGALTVAERVWAEVAKVKTGPTQTVTCTVSLGVSGFPGRGVSSAESLVRTADDALYRAKREGRNKIAIHQAMVLGEVRASQPS